MDRETRELVQRVASLQSQFLVIQGRLGARHEALEKLRKAAATRWEEIAPSSVRDFADAEKLESEMLTTIRSLRVQLRKRNEAIQPLMTSSKGLGTLVPSKKRRALKRLGELLEEDNRFGVPEREHLMDVYEHLVHQFEDLVIAAESRSDG
jgi:hypothetical protein